MKNSRGYNTLNYFTFLANLPITFFINKIINVLVIVTLEINKN